MANNRLAKWNKWLDIIYEEITHLSIHRHIFWEVQEIIKNNPKIQKPSSFYEFLGAAYLSLALMGVRRQIKIDRGSVSFARLLTEMAETPEIISRIWFVSDYTFGNQDFDEFAGVGGNHVNPSLVEADLVNLKSKAQGCEKYADWRIAHFDKRAMKNVPTFGDLDDCIDFLEELLKKYYHLFRRAALASVLPTWQYNWQEIFQEPWLPLKKSCRGQHNES